MINIINQNDIFNGKWFVEISSCCNMKGVLALRKESRSDVTLILELVLSLSFKFCTWASYLDFHFRWIQKNHWFRSIHKAVAGFKREMDRGRETKIGRWGEREGGRETEGRREAGKEETQGARTDPSLIAASGRCLPLSTPASHSSLWH